MKMCSSQLTNKMANTTNDGGLLWAGFSVVFLGRWCVHQLEEQELSERDDKAAKERTRNKSELSVEHQKSNRPRTQKAAVVAVDPSCELL